MTELASYLSGAWTCGSGAGAALLNPSTEEVVATASTEGLDLGAALAHARDEGGPRLRAMSFAERGELLRAMSKAIYAKRDELIGLAMTNGGNTRSDAKFDIDGATGTLAFYADLGKELGDAHVLADGDGVQLGRSARLFGAHVYTPRRGVAVHVNAFNFPAWGLAEKAATALLAGMPVFCKPATSTALVAHRISELLVESGALPAGAFSLLAGGAGALTSHLGAQDVLAFTGGSSTARTLRAEASVVERGVRLNVEADSLNAAVLGPDVELGSDLENLFTADVARDIQQKTGQKCTAIRRVYVPRERLAEIADLLAERLRAIKVGVPSHDDVTMGPLATRSQLRDVREGAKRIQAAAKLVFGDPDRVAALGRDGDKGFFMSPLLFVHEQPSAADVVHSHEVFGPCATVMPYDGTGEDAARLVAAGGGGLVTSVYSDDPRFLAAAVIGSAAFNGRVVIGSSKVASQAIAPGLVMPHLLHGGPGRAGGGEELGGRRGLSFYMQRTAVQGDRALLDALTGKR
ncbi:MAG TPA: 3,4-dehydroadipyl-CoA semialdehyde dehydrogenase [Polyangiaceae bacterium]|nr:3,4-dehydroadipyl-CoA semialdehyde dehydrogenase [Polyangiaceae bacterium]